MAESRQWQSELEEYIRQGEPSARRCSKVPRMLFQSAKDVAPKCQNDTLELSMEELALLKVIKNNPAITQAELVGITGQSLRTIKRLMAAMQVKGCIARQGGKRFGHWQIL